MTSRRRLIVNFLGFELGWFACVVGGAHQLLWGGPLITLVAIAIHLRNATYPPYELGWLIAGTLLGSVFDQSLLSAGWVAYPPSAWPQWLLPPWMCALWLGFCSALNVSMRWLRNYPKLAVLFGVVGAPLSYWGGVKLGAMIWLQPWHVVGALAMGWGVLMPVLLKLAATIDVYAKGKR